MKSFQSIFLALFVVFFSIGNAKASEQIDAIRYVEGRWNMESSFSEGGKWGDPETPTLATGKRVLGDAFIRMKLPVHFPGETFQFEMTFSYDRFNSAYRLVLLDDVNGYMDVYSGQIKDGVLIVMNENTGTAFPDGAGGFVYGKLKIQQAKNGFQIEAFTSSGARDPFAPYMKLIFTADAKGASSKD